MIMTFEQRCKALSNQCRYAGSVDRFFSVAEHTVRGVETMQFTGCTEDDQRAFWLHDMPEGPYGDIITPVKRDPAVSRRWHELETVDFADMVREVGLPSGFMEQHKGVVELYDGLMFTVEVHAVADDYVRGRCEPETLARFKPNTSNVHRWLYDQIVQSDWDSNDAEQACLHHYRRLFK